MEGRAGATRFSTVITFIVVAQISMAFPVGRVSGQDRPVVAHNTLMARMRPVGQVKPGPCLDNCRVNLRTCIGSADNSPRLRDQCLKRYKTCLKKCESTPPSPTQPKPGSEVRAKGGSITGANWAPVSVGSGANKTINGRGGAIPLRGTL